MSVAVYGPQQGYSSFEVVTRGLIEGARANGCLAGAVDPDAVSAWSEPADLYEALQAPVAICAGPYATANWIKTIGSHASVYVMVAPNSTWVPAAFWDVHVSGILTPSQWGQEVLLDAAPYDVDIKVVPHGLLHGHGRPSHSVMTSIKRDERFTILHLAGSSLERKGTYELLRAFSTWRNRGDSLLAMVVNPIEWKKLNEEVEAMGLSKNVAVATRLNASPPVMARLYASSHLVCQPSRAEGFGLVPLEALAAGTPVAITLSTGHLQYALEDGAPIDGVLGIETGPDAEVRYDPGGLAPSVEPDAIQAALEDAFSFHDLFERHTVRSCRDLLDKYSWQETTKPFFSALGRSTNAS